MVKKLRTPINDEVRKSLLAGEEVLISGIIYTARDAAHKNMVDNIKEKKPLPFDVNDQVVYYVGPTPAKPGQAIGAAGPTSSYRMDAFSPYLMEQGLKVMIGKGERTKPFTKEIIKYEAVYLVAIGGLGALLSKTVKSAEVIAYPELQAEAVRKLVVETSTRPTSTSPRSATPSSGTRSCPRVSSTRRCSSRRRGTARTQRGSPTRSSPTRRPSASSSSCRT